MSDGHGFKVPDNSLRRIAFYDNYLDGNSVGLGDGFQISNNQATAASQMPDTFTIARNYIAHFDGCISTIANHGTITDNECDRMTTGETDHIHPYGDTLLFRNNYMHGNLYTDCPGCHSDCFQVFNLGGSNETLRYARNVTIDGNTCLNFDEHIITSNSTSNSSLMANWTVTNNVFAGYRIGSSAGGGGFANTSNVRFYHNTIYNAVFGCGRSDGSVNATVTVENNILDGPWSIQAHCTAQVTNNIDKSSGKFMNAAANDFHLASGSQAINTGLTGLGVATDHDDAMRDAQPDLGAYEFGAIAGSVIPRAPQNVQIVR
jgi:hypothetical protein